MTVHEDIFRHYPDLRLAAVPEGGGLFRVQVEDVRAILPKPAQPAATITIPSGPGTELHKLLSEIGFDATNTCQCAARMNEMDRRGPDWCADNAEIIVGWLEEEARNRALPFSRIMARKLVGKAIERGRNGL